MGALFLVWGCIVAATGSVWVAGIIWLLAVVWALFAVAAR
jgi:hypothetical protein